MLPNPHTFSDFYTLLPAVPVTRESPQSLLLTAATRQVELFVDSPMCCQKGCTFQLTTHFFRGIRIGDSEVLPPWSLLLKSDIMKQYFRVTRPTRWGKFCMTADEVSQNKSVQTVRVGEHNL